jgi:hypothetical protein
MFGRVLQTDTHRKSLGHSDPIQRWFHVRSRPRDVDLVCGKDSVSDTIYNALYRLAAIDHRVNSHAFTDPDAAQISLTEIRRSEPLFRINESKERL